MWNGSGSGSKNAWHRLVGEEGEVVFPAVKVAQTRTSLPRRITILTPVHVTSTLVTALQQMRICPLRRSSHFCADDSADSCSQSALCLGQLVRQRLCRRGSTKPARRPPFRDRKSTRLNSS